MIGILLHMSDGKNAIDRGTDSSVKEKETAMNDEIDMYTLALATYIYDTKRRVYW